MPIDYQIEPELSVDEFIDVLQRSTLAERRPVNDLDTIAGMLRNASIICTARDNTRLVGIARSLTDFCYCTYLSDLAVDQAYQRQGIGRELIARTHAQAGLNTSLILLAAPAARSYYPHIGLTAHDSCWYLARQPVSPTADGHSAAGHSADGHFTVQQVPDQSVPEIQEPR